VVHSLEVPIEATRDLRVRVEVVNAVGMTYLVKRKKRFYVVAYDGLDPLTGRERRRWHPTGADRAEAEAVAARLHNEPVAPRPSRGCPITLGDFMVKTWLPQKRRQVLATTAYRYAWLAQNYIVPAIGAIPVARLRADHLDDLYESLATAGGRTGAGLAPKTIHEVHMIIRACLDQAVNRKLVAHNVAYDSHSGPSRRATVAARAWSATELRTFLAGAAPHRMYPALHLAAHTGMRRGEIVGLKWRDLDPARSRLSITRTLQNVGGRPVEFPVKTRTSQRSVDLDETTIGELRRWRIRLQREQLPQGDHDWMFLNPAGRPINPDSLSQLFDRIVRSSPLPRISIHGLRHTHASLLVAAGTPIKVVSERLGHAHPGFTMHTYRHLLPGMSAAAAEQFATLIDRQAGRRLPATPARNSRS
jgi:integrase